MSKKNTDAAKTSVKDRRAHKGRKTATEQFIVVHATKDNDGTRSPRYWERGHHVVVDNAEPLADVIVPSSSSFSVLHEKSEE